MKQITGMWYSYNIVLSALNKIQIRTRTYQRILGISSYDSAEIDEFCQISNSVSVH